MVSSHANHTRWGKERFRGIYLIYDSASVQWKSKYWLIILKYKCPCAIAKTSFFCLQGISLWWTRNKLIGNIWYTDIICLRQCHSYPCLLVKYGLGPRIFLRCGLIPKPILYYLCRQRPGDVKSVQWYFNKTEIASLLFSKHASFLTCARYRGKKQYHFSGIVFI